jgi:hypothetical protein
MTMAKKSRGQKRQAKIKKRQQRRSRPTSPQSMPLPFLGGMPFGGEPETPKGFRPVSTTQAMMEYAAPIMASPFNIVTFCAVKLAINASFSRWYGVHPG